MIDDIKLAIPLSATNHCIQLYKDSELKVYDDEKKWCLAVEDEPFNFLINNPSNINFYLFAIDKCCLNHKFKGRRCDFGIIIENQHIYLVEIKDTIVDERKKADPIAQIENTIKHFENLNLLETYPKRTAILCWYSRPPIPATDSSYNTAKVKFAIKYKFLLKEGNSETIS